MKIAIVYLSLLHYRKSFFNILLNDKKDDYYILYGDKSPYESMKNFKINSRKAIPLKNKMIGIWKHKLVFQKGAIREIYHIQPDVVVLAGVDLHILSNLFIAIFLKIFSRIRIIWWGHGTFGNQGKFGKIIRTIFYKISDGVLLYSNNESANMRDIKLKSNTIQVVSNAVNSEDYGFNNYNNIIEMREKEKNERKLFNILYIGRIVPDKKINILIESYRELIDSDEAKYSLTIIGDGPEKNKLIDLVKSYSLYENVIFTGSIYGTHLNDYLMKMDLCVIPGYLGLSGIHVNSYGIPIVTNTNMDLHAPEINFLIDNISGSLFIEDDVADLTRQIKKWEKLLYDKFHNINVNIIHETKKYTPEAMARNFSNGIKNILI